MYSSSSSSFQAPSLHPQPLQQDHATLISTVLLISTTTLLFLFLVRRTTGQQQHPKNKKPLPPSDRGWIPFIGVALPFFADVNKYLARKHEQHPPNQPFRIFFLGRWWSFVYNLADIKLILNSKDSEVDFLGGCSDLMKDMLPKKFTFVARHRFFLNIFREANMPLIAQWLVEEVQDVVSLLLLPPVPPTSASGAPAPTAAARGAIDLFESCRHIVMRLNLRVLFGPQMFTQGRYERYYDAFAVIDPEKGLVDVLSTLFGDPNKKERAWDTITEITGEILDYYTELERKVEKAGSGECECVMHFLVRQHLQQQQQQQQQQAQQQSGTHTHTSSSSSSSSLDLETVVKDTFSFVFAAFTNSFAVMAWSIWEMGNEGNLRERVLAECMKHDDKKNKSKNMAQATEKWVVGKAMIDEVIRLTTPGLFFRKVVAPEGVALSTGHYVPTGEFIAFSARALATLPEFFQDPWKFDIDRYLIREEKKKAGIFSLQWGGGRHPCLGTKFATMEILLVVREVFSKYTLTKVTEEVETSKSQLGTSDKPTSPVYITVVEKKTTTV